MCMYARACARCSHTDGSRFDTLYCRYSTVPSILLYKGFLLYLLVMVRGTRGERPGSRLDDDVCLGFSNLLRVMSAFTARCVRHRTGLTRLIPLLMTLPLSSAPFSPRSQFALNSALAPKVATEIGTGMEAREVSLVSAHSRKYARRAHPCHRLGGGQREAKVAR